MVFKSVSQTLHSLVLGILVAVIVAGAMAAMATVARAQGVCVGPNCPPQRSYSRVFRVFNVQPQWSQPAAPVYPQQLDYQYQQPRQRVIVQRQWVPRQMEWRPRVWR